MTSFNPSDKVGSSGSAYENAMKNILKKRTGKSFQRNLEAAPIPVQETSLSHEEVADQIFDNIIRRKREKAQRTEQSKASPESAESVSQSNDQTPETMHQDHLDEILWPDEVKISEHASQSKASNQTSETVYETPSEHLDALAQQYAAELDQILGFD